MESIKKDKNLSPHPPHGEDALRRQAFQIIILMGIVSLCGDITYEGARSITGPFLATLGASAAAVGLVAGAGEFLGYAIRLVTGYLADRTERYWVFTILGYGLILAIPFLAFAGNWPLAAGLIIVERLGKAIRSPARDTILSYATQKVGRGLGFGLHEALDQIGAVIGPLIFTVVLFLHDGYRLGFSLLFVPGILVLVVLYFARQKVPAPEKLEKPSPSAGESDGKKLPRVFWLYTFFILFSMAGFASFPLLAFHFQKHSIISDAQIPLFYAVAMGVDAVAALAIGKIYDRIGLVSLITIPVFTVFIPLLGFSESAGMALAAIIIWGVSMGIQETIMRAAIADLIPMARRGLAYGIFNTAYGTAWLLGSGLMGILYEHSISYIIWFTVIMELVSIPLLLSVRRLGTGNRGKP
ncbi:MAG: MFS transporter [Proteobacteria bacterium]|nr:MFS transporter [Pseudomonadota bacterium]